MRALLVLWGAAAAVGVDGGALLPAAGPCADTVARWSTLTIGPPRVQIACKVGPPATSGIEPVGDGTNALALYSENENYTAALQEVLGTTSEKVADTLKHFGVDHTLCIADACVVAPELPCGPALVDGFRVCTPVAPKIDPPCFTGAHVTCSELITAGVSAAGGAVVGWLSVLASPPKL